MLALGTYLLGSLVSYVKESCIIPYKRGLLFYYCRRGVPRCLNTNNKQQARVFLCSFINLLEFVPLRKIGYESLINQFINNLIF